jgi:uncharacterized membrane protein YozB (DUF420 family)
MDLRLQPGFFGTGASLLADLTLVAYVFLLVPAMLVGFFFARRKWFEPHHKMTMTTITIANWVLILALMVGSYSAGVLPRLGENISNPRYLLPTLHLITGALAQFTATYLVIRMWFEDQLPGWFKVQNIKRPMRFTLAGWLVTVLLGVGIYFTWYTGQSAAVPETPASTQEPAATEGAAATPEAAATEDATATPEAAAPEATAEPSATEEAAG